MPVRVFASVPTVAPAYPKEASENKLQGCGAGSWMPRAARFRGQYWLYWQGIGWRWAPRDGAETRNWLMDAS